MTPRLYVEGLALSAGATLSLTEGAARHAQVLRMQPGDAVTLFNGAGGEWRAVVTRMGRREVEVCLTQHEAVCRELTMHVTLAVGVPANDRMDALIEKATELGAAAIQPLLCARSVVKLEGERAHKKVAHWQGIAMAASEQSGRTRVPVIHPVMPLKAWLAEPPEAGAGGVLSFAPDLSLAAWVNEACQRPPESNATGGRLLSLSGPEGGLTAEEEGWARALGWQAVGLGPRVLRADTAPLMVLSAVGCAEMARGG